MKKRLLLMAIMAMLALFGPAAFAQDDDDDVAAQAAPLPGTGGLALVVPVAGALLLGSGVAGAVLLLGFCPSRSKQIEEYTHGRAVLQHVLECAWKDSNLRHMV